MRRDWRTRRPKMTKIPYSKNPIRSAQNVGRVLTSQGVQALIQKGSILAKISKGHILGKIWSPGPIWALLGPCCYPFQWIVSTVISTSYALSCSVSSPLGTHNFGSPLFSGHFWGPFQSPLCICSSILFGDQVRLSCR